MEEYANIPDLLFRYFIGTLDAAGQQELQKWLDSSEKHRTMLKDLNDMDRFFAEMDRLDAMPPPPPLEELLKGLDLPPVPRKRSLARSVVKIAAVVAGLVILVSLVFWAIRKPSTQLVVGKKGLMKDGFGWSGNIGGVDIYQWCDHFSFVRTGPGDNASSIDLIAKDRPLTIDLPEGSSVLLDTSSSLQLASNFGIGNRELELKGKAVFDVRSAQKNFEPDAPFFTVHTPRWIGDKQGLTFIARGTTFRIDASKKGDSIQVLLQTGSLLIKKGDSVLCHLHPRELFVIHSDGKFFVHSTEQQYKAPDVKSIRDEFYFDEKPIAEILAQLSKWYKVRFLTGGKLNDPWSLLGHRSESLDDILKGMPQTLHFEKKDSSTYVVSH